MERGAGSGKLPAPCSLLHAHHSSEQTIGPLSAAKPELSANTEYLSQAPQFGERLGQQMQQRVVPLSPRGTRGIPARILGVARNDWRPHLPQFIIWHGLEWLSEPARPEN